MVGVMDEKEFLRKSSPSEIKLMNQSLDVDPYKNLANAIVAVAVDDYRFALKEKDNDLKESLEEFFLSEWYKTLTNLDPNVLMSSIYKEVYLEMHLAQ